MTLTLDQLVVVALLLVFISAIIISLFRSLRTRLKAAVKTRREFFDMIRQKDIQYSRILQDKQKRSGFYSNLIDKLPFRTSEMISQEDPRKLARVLVDSVVDLFEPTRVVFFTAMPEIRQLVLTDGFSTEPSKFGKRYDYGKGRPGVVAQKGITMTTLDFLNESTMVKRRIREHQSSECQMDIFSPLIKDGHLLGIVGMKRIGQDFTTDEKRVFRMVADMAANAFAFSYLLARYKKMAHRDGLTGLVNRKSFMTMFAKQLTQASIGSDQLSVFMFDLDNFKVYNDRNGHLEGDKLLKMISKMVLENIRTNDVAARYGGEEFIVLFPGLSRKKAYRVSEYLRKKIEAHPFPHREGQPLGMVSISGGIASFPEDGDTVHELISTADQRLYRAKNKGRNRVMLSTM
ncbi:MAG: sensor domain-containing diguanylate cyclase [Acidobacteria bacterium]|nr:sensor domain-containing diguanylate cyclase [Acidobacteriota bacterium]